jgi:CheY-like chemotaxis protein
MKNEAQAPARICLVEDTKDLLENLATYLRLEGFDVLPCENAETALAMLPQFKFDLIITDLWMPGMNGFEFIEALHQDAALAKIPIVVFSAAPLSAGDRERLSGRVVGYLNKPVEVDRITEMLNGFIN